ncbi:hypothetical protein Syun_011469 [Stephania yunnanensis]|uniref:Uncharacterized protein n=1 Tax=Stephania yunnanensis TaxID=152371 RepID=A0AAP0JYB6_9MAGN
MVYKSKDDEMKKEDRLEILRSRPGDSVLYHLEKVYTKREVSRILRKRYKLSRRHRRKPSVKAMVACQDFDKVLQKEVHRRLERARELAEEQTKEMERTITQGLARVAITELHGD